MLNIRCCTRTFCMTAIKCLRCRGYMRCRLLLYLFLDYHLGYTNGVAMVRGACQWPKENPAMNADRLYPGASWLCTLWEWRLSVYLVLRVSIVQSSSLKSARSKSVCRRLAPPYYGPTLMVRLPIARPRCHARVLVLRRFSMHPQRRPHIWMSELYN